MFEEENLDKLIDELIAGKPPLDSEALAGAAAAVAGLNSLVARTEAKARGRHLLLARGRELARAKQETLRARVRRRLMTIAAAFMALTLASTGTVYAASNSMPGDVLYPVKTATEDARLVFIPRGQARAEAQMNLARVRLREIQTLRRLKDERRLGPLIAAFNRRLALARAEQGLNAAQAARLGAATRILSRSAKGSSTFKPIELLNRRPAPKPIGVSPVPVTPRAKIRALIERRIDRLQKPNLPGRPRLKR